MRLGVIQSSFAPWRGFFDFIDDVDLFLLYDDTQFVKNSWRNRNRIKTPRGADWITVPVRKGPLARTIDETQIDAARGWPERPLNQLRENYRAAPHFDAVYAECERLFDAERESLSRLNESILRWGADRLGVTTPIRRSSEFAAGGRRSERLIALCREIGATTYLSGPSAAAYLDLDAFAQAGIAVEWKVYDYAPYPQLHGAFEGAVSVIDLFMNVGPDARAHLKSRAPNRPARPD